MKFKWIFLCILGGIAVWLVNDLPKEMQPPQIILWDEDTLSSISSDQLKKMLGAGKNLQNKPNVIKELLSGKELFQEFEHYPEKNVIDDLHGSEYFYHAHRPNEHGHFHVFVKEGNKTSHLIGISITESGDVKSLFTVNQWVTGDLWKSAKELSSYLEQFHINDSQSPVQTNSWISDLICLFSPQIKELLEERDRFISQSANKNFLKDRSLEVLTEMEVSVSLQVESIQKLTNTNMPTQF